MHRIDPINNMTVISSVTAHVRMGLTQEQAVNAVAILNIVRRYAYIARCISDNYTNNTNNQ